MQAVYGNQGNIRENEDPRERPLKILYASSELAPFSKSGGLGDVAASLPVALSKAGHDIRVITPLYRSCRNKARNLQTLAGFRKIRLGQSVYPMGIEVGHIPNSTVPVYFVSNDRFYDRAELYNENGQDYPDNASRFIFFARAVLEVLYMTDFVPDVIHTNDWQTGLTSVFLKTLYSHDAWTADCATVFTIHNMAYQGHFWNLDMPLTGLPWSYFNADGLEFYGKMNLMKAGLIWSEIITTVSDRYAQEIQNPDQGYGLHGVLRGRKDSLFGVLNGIDTDIWNPETDRFLNHNFSKDNLEGKKMCKAELQEFFGLPISDAPLVSMIGRICDQKGFDIVMDTFDHLMRLGIQFVVLGKGDYGVENRLWHLADRYPQQARVLYAFDEKLAHYIEAGSDIFLMPSKYEPCGLNQMYSMTYGTIPVVKETGGLADTVPDYSADPENGRGFSFWEHSPRALYDGIRRAVEMYNERPEEWLALKKRVMSLDFSWDRSAEKMVDIYRLAIDKRIGV